MQNQTETRLNMSIHSSIVLQALQGGVSFLRLRETFSPCSSGFAWRSHLRMGFPKNHHHTMGPSGCVKVSRGAGCCCAPWGGTSGSGRARWVLPLPVHTLFLCQLKHYFSLSQAPATTLNLKACFGVICAGWRVTYCKHYIWLSPGGLLGKESNSRSSNLGDSTKHRLFVKCQMTVTSGGKLGCWGCPCLCEYDPYSLVYWVQGKRLYCLFCSMGALVASQMWDYVDVHHMCLIHCATEQLRTGMVF